MLLVILIFVVVQEAEAKHWKQLGINYYMTDDPTDPNAIMVHPLPWRLQSTKLTLFSTEELRRGNCTKPVREDISQLD